MKRKASNPFKVFLSGLIDCVSWFVVCIIIFWIFDAEKYETLLKGSFHSLASFLGCMFTLFYLFILLPFIEYRGGSVGKRIMGLKNLRKDRSVNTVPFNSFFKKSLVIGFPIVLLFMICAVESYSEKNVWPIHLAIDILLIGIFIIQIISVFIARLSFLEWISGTIISDKKRTIEDLSFSFDHYEEIETAK